MRYQLYDFQQQAIDEIEAGIDNGYKRQILALPTGSGKTVTAAHMIHKRAQRGERSLFIVDRIELVLQAAEKLEAMGLQVGILQADNTCLSPNDEVTVASIQTIRSRGARFANFIMIDECHLLHQAHIDLMRDLFYIPAVGLSATPMRRDLGKHFDRLVRGPSVQQLMADGHLVKQVDTYCPGSVAMCRILDNVRTRCGDFIEGELSESINTKELVGDIVATWQEKASDRQTLCFAVDIAHSKAIVEDFQYAGIRAEHLDAYTKPEDRDRIIRAFRNHDLQLLSSVNVLGIGFDMPAASCAILARPTLSEMLDMQQKGRVLRKCDGKDNAIILDHAGNTLRFGLPQDFTVPDLDQEDHTSTKERRKQQKMVVCKECNYALEPDQMTCPMCGYDRQVRQNKVTYIDGKLVAYGDQSAGAEHSPEDQQNWYLAFLWHARFNNHKDGWAFYAFISKFGEKPPWHWKNLEPVMPTDEQARWLKYYQIKRYRSWKKRA